MQIWTFAYEHKTQSIFVLLQMITVIAGMCFIRGIGKLTEEMSPKPLIYHTGFLLLAAPPAWAVLTMYLERRFEHRYPSWATFLSGMALFLTLLGYFYSCNFEMLIGPPH